MQTSDIDIKMLRIFVAIAECGGFSAAQAKLNLSQPTISNQVKALEERLKCRLCTRGRSGFRLTREGEKVLTSARKMILGIDIFDKEMDSLHNDLSGRIRFACMDNTATDDNQVFTDAMQRFEARNHSALVELTVASPDEIEFLLLSERVDAAISASKRKIKALSYEYSVSTMTGLACRRYCRKKLPAEHLRLLISILTA